MDEWKIVIVDKEQEVLDLLRAIFEKEGYKVLTVSSGDKAAQVIESLKPHLILSEVDLPGMDGYELCATIKSNPKTRNIPFVFLTDQREIEKKIKGLKLGAIDYITKPFQREELLARVHNIVQSFGSLTESTKKNAKAAKLSLTAGEVIRPVIHGRWKCGYAYPQVAKRVGSEPGGEEIKLLEAQAKKGLLKKELVDLILLCPFCGHHDVNYRNVCPHCHSPHVKWKGLSPTSPKSLQAIREETSQYQCGVCGYGFDRPLNYGHCMYCSKEFERKRAIVKEIYSYKLAEKGNGKGMPSSPNLLQQVLQNIGVESYEMEFFRKQVHLEIKRTQRFGGKTSLLALEFQHVKKLGREVTMKYLHNMLLVVKKCLRELDLIALEDNQRLLILLPETPLGMAKLLANRMRSYMNKLGYPIKINLALAGYPEDGREGDELIDAAKKGLEYNRAEDVFAPA